MFKMSRLSRPVWSSFTYNLVFAAFITLIQNIAYYRQVSHLVAINTWRDGLFLATMPVVIFAVLNILFALLVISWLRQGVVALLLVGGAAVQYFMINYGIIIDRTMMQNVFETNMAESMALVTPQYLLWLTLLGLIPALGALWVKIKPTPLSWIAVGARCFSILMSIVAILLVATFFYKDYASLMRNNKELVKSLTPSNIIFANISYYRHHVQANLPLVQIGLDAHKKPLPSSDAKKNLVILVVGETSRAENFSLGGYGKPTNPLLANDNVVYFSQTASCGTSTGVSVPCMFSNMPRAGYDEQLAAHQEGLLDVLQHAGVNVRWQENDGGCKGACDRVPSQDITALNLPGQCTGGECHDEALFSGVEDYINQLNNDGIIVLHTMGSHGPAYYQRYPDAFRKFTPTCDTNQIQTCSRESLINTYDNTILYVDYIVDKAINVLKGHQDKFNTALVYLSDHGESLGEDGIYLHSMPYAVAPTQQTHIPMLMWLSGGYQQQFSIDDSCLRKQAGQQRFSQDNLFHTVLGMFNIATKEYQVPLDILQPCRGTS
ncbi:phosphoethanolamine transferase EptA [Dickeya solani]|uniref:Phosphoethanolamine transferase EptA n=1 Tax=Dickeya solani TaxID=1089444 RepID=A0ABU4EKH1_9GAMM|nr:phosphoethanolamine transferase EptA [Dickeya solani]MCA7000611.1 phosphoethanolamine transferase EptA [Dickeya solani]MCZ0820251.1 phosphoethanolamine transferase EptA [Dickeya solani]MDV6997492.1 phosphoethanolamine transferase EptA [Dickeya solani]MDV7006047.1 phosphoethanolamine transferase EptA [Dickeya solani]MDV7040141.1 phosphoethanolamine transferase EptA [Dickeya solani]